MRNLAYVVNSANDNITALRQTVKQQEKEIAEKSEQAVALQRNYETLSRIRHEPSQSNGTECRAGHQSVILPVPHVLSKLLALRSSQSIQYPYLPPPAFRYSLDPRRSPP
eukprot:2927577-Pleurochrysis_carterae.AAC.2